MNLPDPNKIFPINDIDITYIKPTVKNPNIIVGDFTKISRKALDFSRRDIRL